MNFLLAPFNLNKLPIIVTASIGTFRMAFPTCLVNNLSPDIGSVMAATCAADNIYHFIAIIHSWPPLYKLNIMPVTVKTNVSPKTPAN